MTVSAPATEQKYSEDLLYFYKKNNQGIREKSIFYSESYEKHFTKNKNAILEGCRDLFGRVIVLGFGNGLDIPIEEITEQFDDVIFVDIDGESMELACSELPDHMNEKISLVQDDVTGLMGDLETKIQSIFSREATLTWEQFADTITHLIDELEPQSLDLEPADYVISSVLVIDLETTVFEYITRMAHSNLFPDKPFEETHSRMLRHPSIAKSLVNLSKRLQSKHIQDLHKWTKNSGKTYISWRDHSYALMSGADNIINQIPGTTLTQPELLATITHQFNIQFKKGWPWIVGKKVVQSKTLSPVMWINSYLLQPS